MVRISIYYCTGDLANSVRRGEKKPKGKLHEQTELWVWDKGAGQGQWGRRRVGGKSEPISNCKALYLKFLS